MDGVEVVWVDLLGSLIFYRVEGNLGWNKSISLWFLEGRKLSPNGTRIGKTRKKWKGEIRLILKLEKCRPLPLNLRKGKCIWKIMMVLLYVFRMTFFAVSTNWMKYSLLRESCHKGHVVQAKCGPALQGRGNIKHTDAFWLSYFPLNEGQWMDWLIANQSETWVSWGE